MMQPPDLVQRVLAAAIAARVTPGGVVAVGTSAAAAYSLALGHVTYANGAAPVKADTIYDLASLTKPIASVPASPRA